MLYFKMMSFAMITSSALLLCGFEAAMDDNAVRTKASTDNQHLSIGNHCSTLTNGLFTPATFSKQIQTDPNRSQHVADRLCGLSEHMPGAGDQPEC